MVCFERPVSSRNQATGGITKDPWAKPMVRGRTQTRYDSGARRIDNKQEVGREHSAQLFTRDNVQIQKKERNMREQIMIWKCRRDLPSQSILLDF
jgi:hypothetical protein